LECDCIQHGICGSLHFVPFTQIASFALWWYANATTPLGHNFAYAETLNKMSLRSRFVQRAAVPAADLVSLRATSLNSG
jgi:hypothetical protein